MSEEPGAGWWCRNDLRYENGSLHFAGYDVAVLARMHGSPSFFYSPRRVVQNAERIHAALRESGFAGRYRVLFAMKANRFAPLLTYLQGSGLVGIDACSPNEVEHAMSCGFRPEDISFTNTSLSPADLVRLNCFEGMGMTCDSLSAIRHWGELGRGRDIGIRVNPAMGIGRAGNEKLQYAGAVTTKFGIYREQFHEALALAKSFDLNVVKLHFHVGCGYLTPELPAWEKVIEECLWFVDQVDDLQVVNVGGGLGVPHTAEDTPLDLHAWAGILAQHFLHREVKIEVEPGDYLAKDAGILVLEVNSVEQKRDTLFAGVNAGFAIAPEPAVYGLPFEPVTLLEKAPGTCQRYTLAGHINEALDVFYKNVELPLLLEGEHLVLLNAGAYSASMASNHCMRGEYREFLLA